MTKKEYTELLKKHGAKELAENFVFPVQLEGKEKQKTDEDLKRILTSKRAGFNDEMKLNANLLQLRFQIEDYLNSPVYKKKMDFGFFVRRYIDLLNKKQAEFADEIKIKPAELSQYINSHRTPPKHILIRLELHSHNKIPSVLWHRLLDKKITYELQNDITLRRTQRKFVKKLARAY